MSPVPNSQKLIEQAQQDANGDIVFGYDPEASAGFALLHNGFYHGVIEDCPIKQGPKGPYLALKVRIDPMPGKERGRVMFDNVSFAAQWKLSQVRDAIYGKSEKGEQRINPAELQGAPITIFVNTQKSTRQNNPNPDGLDNNIARYVELNEAQGVALYDWAAELAEPAADAPAGEDWGDDTSGDHEAEPVVRAQHQPETEEELAALVEQGNAPGFQDEAQEPEPVAAPVRRAAPAARPAPAKPATKAAAKKTPARRR